MFRKQKSNRNRRSVRSAIASLFYQLVALELKYDVIARVGKAFRLVRRIADAIDIITKQ